MTDVDRLERDLLVSLDRPVTSAPVGDVSLDFDDLGSPWHTLATARAIDRPGLLHALTSAFAAAGADVHAARVHTNDGYAVAVFELSDVKGPKLTHESHARVRKVLAEGVVERRRRGWRRPGVPTRARRRLRTSPSSA